MSWVGAGVRGASSSFLGGVEEKNDTVERQLQGLIVGERWVRRKAGEVQGDILGMKRRPMRSEVLERGPKRTS